MAQIANIAKTWPIFLFEKLPKTSGIKLILKLSLITVLATIINTLLWANPVSKYIKKVIESNVIPTSLQTIAEPTKQILESLPFSYFEINSIKKQIETDLTPQPYTIIIEPDCNKYSITPFLQPPYNGITYGCSFDKSYNQDNLRRSIAIIINTKESQNPPPIGMFSLFINKTSIAFYNLQSGQKQNYRGRIEPLFDSQTNNPPYIFILFNSKNPSQIAAQKLLDLANAPEEASVFVTDTDSIPDNIRELAKNINTELYNEVLPNSYKIGALVSGLVLVFETAAYAIYIAFASLIAAVILTLVSYIANLKYKGSALSLSKTLAISFFTFTIANTIVTISSGILVLASSISSIHFNELGLLPIALDIYFIKWTKVFAAAIILFIMINYLLYLLSNKNKITRPPKTPNKA